jgi:hypothetical protein
MKLKGARKTEKVLGVAAGVGIVILLFSWLRKK